MSTFVDIIQNYLKSKLKIVNRMTGNEFKDFNLGFPQCTPCTTLKCTVLQVSIKSLDSAFRSGIDPSQSYPEKFLLR